MKKRGFGIWRRGNSWYIDFYVRGQRYTECLGMVSKTFAKEEAVRRKTALIEGRLRPKARDPLFGTFSKEYMETVSANKLSHIREKVAYGHLLPFFKGRRLSQISQLLIEKYKNLSRETDLLAFRSVCLGDFLPFAISAAGTE